MGSKMLTGSMLLGGMILGIIVVFVEPPVSEQDSFAVAIQQLIDNSTQSRIAGVGFTIAVLSAQIGLGYLARSMQGEQKLGSDLAGLASVFAFLAAAASPFLRNQSTASSSAPSVSVSAFLQSIMPAPVFSRSSLTSEAVISTIRIPISLRCTDP